jgi:hypothetical protein
VTPLEVRAVRLFDYGLWAAGATDKDDSGEFLFWHKPQGLFSTTASSPRVPESTRWPRYGAVGLSSPSVVVPSVQCVTCRTIAPEGAGVCSFCGSNPGTGVNDADLADLLALSEASSAVDSESAPVAGPASGQSELERWAAAMGALCSC